MRWLSTRDPRVAVPFRQALLESIPPGGGLWMPAELPRFADWDDLLSDVLPPSPGATG